MRLSKYIHSLISLLSSGHRSLSVAMCLGWQVAVGPTRNEHDLFGNLAVHLLGQEAVMKHGLERVLIINSQDLSRCSEVYEYGTFTETISIEIRMFRSYISLQPQ
jgi:hypothetical protein